MHEGFLERAAREAAKPHASIFGTRTFSTVKKPPNLAKEAPLVANDAVAKCLVDHVNARIMLAKGHRDRLNKTYVAIDNQLFAQPHPKRNAGNDDEDTQARRLADLEAGKDVKPVDRNYGITQAQLSDVETYLLNLFAPDMTLFEGIASESSQTKSLAVANELNNEGIQAQHYTELFKFVRSALRYNFAMMCVDWVEKTGTVFVPGPGGQVQRTQGTVWEGNVLKTLDPYNSFYDLSVSPTMLARDGEYFGWVELISGFQAKRMENEKHLFWTSRFSDAYSPGAQSSDYMYYTKPPHLAHITEDAAVDWPSLIGGIADPKIKDSVPSLEAVHFIGWFDPEMFGTSKPTESVAGTLELWHLIVIGGKYLAYAERMNDTQGLLPVVASVPVPDITQRRLPSLAESLIPPGQYGSFLFNYSAQAARKALGGIILYDQERLPFGELPQGDLVNRHIAIRTSSSAPNVDSAFKQINDAPELSAVPTQLSAIYDLMQRVAPTDFVKQMTDLERATRFQAASVAQGGSRRNLMLARLIYVQAISPLSMMMAKNVLMHKAQITYIEPTTKEKVTVPTASLLDAGIEYTIGTGIRGLDRLILIDTYKELFAMILQSPQANQRIDLVRLLNYLSSLSGDAANLSQFELTDEQFALLMRRQAQAAQAAQGGSAPGTPGTNGGTTPPQQ